VWIEHEMKGHLKPDELEESKRWREFAQKIRTIRKGENEKS
jgi:hypothetical protein